jgi:gluconolactonase
VRQSHAMSSPLIDPGSQLETLAGGFGFIEGPLWHPDGYLLFSDIPGDAIHRWDDKQGISTFRSPSGKANGLAWDRAGRLLACEHVRSAITRTEPDGSVEVIASHWNGKELNSPNDLAVAGDGCVWFTDPHPAGRTAAWGTERDAELDFCGVYRLDPESGDVRLVTDRLVFPNGVCFSPDGRVLYVNDTIEMTINAFDVGDDGAVANERLLIRQGAPSKLVDGRIVPADDNDAGYDFGAPDGMKCDERGNIWCTGPGGVWIIAPEGERLAVVETPEFAANLAWGGVEGTTLFITASSALMRLETMVRGAP